jgi:hypothetical protein
MRCDFVLCDFGSGRLAAVVGNFAVHGPEGVRVHTHLKTVTLRWPSRIRCAGHALGGEISLVFPEQCVAETVP